MLRIILLFTLLLSTKAFSAEPAYPDFEAELRALETNQMKEEIKESELMMNNADAVTDVISDEIKVGQAATLREKNRLDDKDLEALSPKQEPVVHKRRIRSR
ncbi:MAG: hypothetical protein K2Q18_10020 [Bdellovibrionales bacterium]|nr:hypothetical protein [Bdellovibrionales bacterium]